MPRMTKALHDAQVAVARADGFGEAHALLKRLAGADLSPTVATAALAERLAELRGEAEDALAASDARDAPQV